MKTRLYLIVMLLVAAIAAPTALRAADPNAPAISFNEKKFDFGIVKEEGGLVTTEFEFTNTGTAPLIIVSANASCGCTHPAYPKEPIKPGKKGKIKVSFNPKGRVGNFNKTITVRTNVEKQSRVTLRISGDVVR